ncbi:hypothetical protein GQ55_1G321700 [Panicum hallii var. hallii]|uniref:Uncharacterized protein n=1 Tax=Panicum hallii var. hallii TaxID=1504633 RepID=A0A2T7F9T2_9POAL|nr:hypothetical protein GQ55_1G321700 [Panicum hallii var. hallii]
MVNRSLPLLDPRSPAAAAARSMVIIPFRHQIHDDRSLPAAKLVGIGRRHRQICSHQLLRAAKLAVISGHQSPITLH